MTLQKLTYREQNPTLKVVKGLFFSTEKSCAVHYEYDIHGNVKSLLHDNPELAARNPSLADQRYKRMDYTYDLISGNVLQVSYQYAWPDAWHHRYEYDADNRITHAKTSTIPTPLESDWELDAHYLYYHHGPLARTELGEHTVQGIDMSYTLQGWLKGVNSESLYADRDMGKDGNNVLGNSNKYFAKDAFGFSLGYFENDYAAINQPTALNNFLADKTGSNLLASTSNLYNGNISNMVTTIVPPTLTSDGTVTYAPAPQGTAYKYDRLNRLKSSNAWQDINAVGNVWATGNGSTYAGMYENNFNYDANGNILTQGRKDATGTYIDTLTYQYAVNTNGRKVQNRLYHVNDDVLNTAFTEDIDDMGTFNDDVATINDGSNNYQYDEIGNLIKDTQEEIEEIKWRVDGKIAEIKRGSGSNKQNLVFNYDASGNRIAKHLYLYDTNDEYTWEKSTYYVRDAQGNPMAVYDLIASGSSGLSYKVAERDIYGSSRIGLNTTPVEMIGATPPTDIYTHILGDKNYQLENHLGNILAVVTDKKLPVDDGNGNIDYYLPHVISSQDYSAFGVLLENRNFGSEKLRHLFNDMEQDVEISGVGNSYTAEFWQYSPRLGRRWNVDPMFKKYSWQSPYAAFNNNPLVYNDPTGLEGEEANQDETSGVKTPVIDKKALEIQAAKNQLTTAAVKFAISEIKSQINTTNAQGIIDRTQISKMDAGVSVDNAIANNLSITVTIEEFKTKTGVELKVTNINVSLSTGDRGEVKVNNIKAAPLDVGEITQQVITTGTSMIIDNIIGIAVGTKPSIATKTVMFVMDVGGIQTFTGVAGLVLMPSTLNAPTTNDVNKSQRNFLANQVNTSVRSELLKLFKPDRFVPQIQVTRQDNVIPYIPK